MLLASHWCNANFIAPQPNNESLVLNVGYRRPVGEPSVGDV